MWLVDAQPVDSEERISRRRNEKEGLDSEAGRTSAEDVVPVVERRRQKLDLGVKSDHGSSHVLPRGIEIEATPKTAALVKEFRNPSGIGSGT